jgi:hypothetical protein
MKFTYRSGQRPLEGYTLKRGVGQGGFGEVYFGVSDGGKEVALKLLRGHTEIELRGVANCLNLKHPNLVHVYDLKSDDRGDTWLVMEYVLGESMGQVISRHPHGLPLNLCKDWFVSLARAVGFLHDHGVVHRDLKPANIFVENGTLKVGDYGLCKALGASARQQTRTVGTVHYMAPEISTGNYNKQIDVYACGVILHEMLTGNVPFDGESDGEILMKHLTSAPDLTKVPPAFRPVLEKALDKNPLHRYATMTEFARAVEAVPVTASQAGTAAPLPAAGPMPNVPGPTATYPFAAAPPAPAGLIPPPPLPVAAPVAPPAKPEPTFAVRDVMADVSGAMVKAPIFAAMALVPFAILSHTHDWVALGKLFAVTVGVCWAVLLGSAGASSEVPDRWGRRLRLGTMGLIVGALAFWFDGWELPRLASPETPAAERVLFGKVQVTPDASYAGWHYLLYFGAVLAAGKWWRSVVRDRGERFSLGAPVAAGFWGLLLSFLWPWQLGGVWVGGIVPLVLASVAVQFASPWSPPPPPVTARKRLRLV